MQPVDYQLLPAPAIDLGDLTFFLSPEETHPAPHLIDSIREYGTLQPPLVQQRDANRYIVIGGWKRLKTAIAILHWDRVPCIVAPPDCPSLYLYALLLEQSLLGTPLSLMEQCTFFSKMCTTCTVEEALPLLAKLGHKPNRHQLDELLGMRNLSEYAMLALHRGVISYATARKLLRVSPADQGTLVAMITRFRLSGSKQQKLIDLGTVLLRREQRSMEEIATPFLTKIERTGQENIPQQAAALLTWLHEQCSPRSFLAEGEFSRRVARLALPSSMLIAHSPSFEDHSISLALRFSDWDALLEALPAIRQAVAAE